MVVRKGHLGDSNESEPCEKDVLSTPENKGKVEPKMNPAVPEVQCPWAIPCESAVICGKKQNQISARMDVSQPSL